MSVRGRKTERWGPFVVNFASDGFARWRVTGWGLRVGRWSWSSRTGQHRVNLPGPWTWTSPRPAGRRAGRARRGQGGRR